jgi:5-(carboxyamino)imidazole ribonucleotide synthase
MNPTTSYPKVLGILGGGQLGSMMLDPIHRLGIKAKFMDPDPLAPVSVRFPSVERASPADEESVMAFGRKCDVLTYELEAVHAGALARLAGEGKQIWHLAETLALLQNKITQKNYYQRQGLDTAPYRSFESKDEWLQLLTSPDGIFVNFPHQPLVWKSAQGGYDGKGVRVLHSIEEALEAPDVPCILEQKIDIALELAVLTVRDQRGNVRCYDPCLMQFDPNANLVSRVMAGSLKVTEALLPAPLQAKAKEMATAVAEGLQTVGVLAVEFLLDTQGQLWVNESAPRPHNSGHYTIEAAYCSQFEQHVRAVMGLPLGDSTLRSSVVMVNLVGMPGLVGPVTYHGLDRVLALPGVSVHLYGKAETRPYRKMGHVTIVHPDLNQAIQLADQVEDFIQIGVQSGEPNPK